MLNIIDTYVNPRKWKWQMKDEGMEEEKEDKYDDNKSINDGTDMDEEY
jgi:hypothetical protein